MFDWFKKDTPERCVDDIVNRYFDSEEVMSDTDFAKLKDCLKKWNAHDNPEFVGAMAYVRYREGMMNKMWDYIEKDLEMELGEEEHGAFIPAMMADVEPKVRYEILKKIHRRIGSELALEVMANIAKELHREDEVRNFVEEALKKAPQSHRLKKIQEMLSV